MSLAKILVPTLSLAVVAAIALWETDQRGSPGPLHPSHAQVTGLAQDCERCHGDTAKTMTDACLACHQALQQQLQAEAGLHAELEPELRSQCGRCHAEHGGERVPLVHARSFAAAGIEDPRSYPDVHPVGFRLDGTHEDLSCTECHANAELPLLAEDQHRFGGLRQDCTHCHEDTHEGRLGADCASCHGQNDPFDQVTSFEHTLDFPLSDGHAGKRCVDCHERGSRHDFERQREAKATTVRACMDCHEDPHTRADSGKVQLTGSSDCARCHDRSAFTNASFGVQAHAQIGVVLANAHRELACVDCHSEPKSADSRPRSMERCESCHADVHGRGERAPALATATRCSRCHEDVSFTEEHRKSFPHESTGFRLEGEHAHVSCAECHSASGPVRSHTGPAPRTWDCATCHESPHRVDFVARVAELRRLANRDTCTICHSEEHESFLRPHAQLPEDLHGASGFVLEYGHAERACVDCHVEPKRTKYAVRFPGRSPQDCAECHEDVHAGQFEQSAGSAAHCRHCHDTHAFSPSHFGLKRHRQTAMPLVGAHQAVPCLKCHVPPKATRTTATRYRGLPADCASCHEDVHGGRFDRAPAPQSVAGRRGCERCHTSTSFRDFVEEGFDHAEWTGYGLTGGHAKASCKQCHPERPRNGKYLPPAQTCASCHEDPHAGQFRDAVGRTDCSRCHDDKPGWEASRFDHSQHSRFALDATHRTLDCSACHKPVPHEGRAVVRFKPLGRECADCHAKWTKEGKR